ncbi:C2H2-type zinc finger protein [Endozoicomonas euniceicola]|uniref:C2H2-type zinc finger protein n=1 Tax=Endozoicomonas euniceicola TaxID=1234143 RepID=A0ABY6GPL9_9GAMM|nr:C2H2-type zinc finger protein [Endozoicomonas euniceicola]UYM14364.1 C2H2-type zinc finger protein [Endozoicomonas euniceicola]
MGKKNNAPVFVFSKKMLAAVFLLWLAVMVDNTRGEWVTPASVHQGGIAHVASRLWLQQQPVLKSAMDEKVAVSKRSAAVVILVEDDGFSVLATEPAAFTWQDACNATTLSDMNRHLRCHDPNALLTGLRATLQFSHSGESVQVTGFASVLQVQTTGGTDLAIAPFQSDSPGLPDQQYEQQYRAILEYLSRQRRKSEEIDRRTRCWTNAMSRLAPEKPDEVLRQEQKIKELRAPVRFHYSLAHRSAPQDETFWFFTDKMEGRKVVLTPDNNLSACSPVSLPSGSMVDLSNGSKRNPPPVDKPAATKSKKRKLSTSNSESPQSVTNPQTEGYPVIPDIPIKQEENVIEFGERKVLTSAELFIIKPESGITRKPPEPPFKTNCKILGAPAFWKLFTKKKRQQLKNRILEYINKTNEEREAHIEGLVREVRYEANEGDPYQALDGQKHVVAAKKLSKGTVLGHYRGSLWLIDENAPSPECGTLDQQISYSVNCDYKGEGEEATDDCQEMYWLSGYDDGNIFSCVNDCTVTSNADHDTATVEPNVSFITVYMDDFPVVMVVTTEDIPEGKGLWLSYGKPYWDYKNEPVVVPDGDDDHSGAGAKNRKYKCDLCGRELAHFGSLVRHKRTHTGEKLYECDVCQKRFARSGHLARHNRIHTGEKPYECDVCQKRFVNSGNLAAHRLRHTGEKPHECDVCQKRFACSSNFLRHRRTHTGAKPYECDVCKKTFTQSGHLKVHKHTHTREKPYKCDVCKKTFTQSGHLKVHKHTHTREKPYKCDVCEKGFCASGNLATHRRSHTGEKPYECDKCQKRFAQSGGLVKHKRSHTGERPHECDKCQKRFTQSGDLIRHKRTHTGEKPYECDKCQKRFSRLEHLVKHKRTQHKESPTEQPPQQ